MANWLAGIGGGALGLSKTLSDQIAREQLDRRQAEIERSNRAEEAYKSKFLEGATDDRRLAREAALDARQRADARALTDDVRLRYGQLPMKTLIEPGQFAQDVKTGGVSPAAGEEVAIPDRLATRSGVPASLAQNESMIRLRGTPTEIAAVANLEATQAQRAVLDADRDAARAQTKAHQDAMEQLSRENLALRREFGPPTIVIADPNNPGRTLAVPRNTIPVTGARGVEPASSRDKINAYTTTLKMIDDLKEFTDEEWAAAVGPVDSTLGATMHQRFGIDALGGGGSRGELLRNRLGRLQAQASFAEGGKQFTGTEKDLLEAFLAAAKYQPGTARGRMEEFERIARGTLSTLGAPQADSTGGMGTGVGGGTSDAASQEETPEARAARIRAAAGL